MRSKAETIPHADVARECLSEISCAHLEGLPALREIQHSHEKPAHLWEFPDC